MMAVATKATNVLPFQDRSSGARIPRTGRMHSMMHLLILCTPKDAIRNICPENGAPRDPAQVNHLHALPPKNSAGRYSTFLRDDRAKKILVYSPFTEI